MKNDFLFPHSFRIIGLIILVPALFLGISVFFFNQIIPFLGENADEVATIAIILALLFMGFSREKEEDEMIRQIRLQSLQWSVYVNYLFLIIGVLFFFDFKFIQILIYNMFTVLVVFVVRYFWSMKRLNLQK